MDLVSRSGQVKTRSQELHSGLALGLGSSPLAFPGVLAGNWIVSRAAETETFGLIGDADTASDVLTSAQ